MFTTTAHHKQKFRRFLAQRAKLLTIFSAAGKIFNITIVLMLLGALSGGREDPLNDERSGAPGPGLDYGSGGPGPYFSGRPFEKILLLEANFLIVFTAKAKIFAFFSRQNFLQLRLPEAKILQF
jgi:hypothetical protein